MISVNKNRKYAFTVALLKLPVIGDIVRKYQVNYFMYTLGMLINSGLPVSKALSIAKVGCSIFSIYQVEKEESIANFLDKNGVLDDFVISWINESEEDGTLEEALTDIADGYYRQMDKQISFFIGIFEPIIIMLMIYAIGFIIIALHLPFVGLVVQFGIIF